MIGDAETVYNRSGVEQACRRGAGVASLFETNQQTQQQVCHPYDTHASFGKIMAKYIGSGAPLRLRAELSQRAANASKVKGATSEKTKAQLKSDAAVPNKKRQGSMMDDKVCVCFCNLS